MSKGRPNRTPTRAQARMLDRLAKVFQGESPARLQSALRKTATLNLRVTPAEKADLEAVAKDLGLSVTEYIERCHVLVSLKLREGGRKG